VSGWRNFASARAWLKPAAGALIVVFGLSGLAHAARGPVALLVAEGALALQLLAARRPGTDPTQLVAVGLDALARRIGEFVDVGFSKFVAVPLTDPDGPLDEHLGRLAEHVLPLET